MLAPNMTLELGPREPIQNSGNSQRVDQKSGEPSSFERALERARIEKSEVPKAEESAQTQVARKAEEPAQEQAPAKTESLAAASAQQQDESKAPTETKRLNLTVTVEEHVLLPEIEADGEVAVQLAAQELEGESLDALVLEDEAVAMDPLLEPDPESLVLGQEGALVQAESLEEAAKVQLSQLDATEKKTKKLSPEDADYTIAQILQAGGQDTASVADVSLAEGAVAEMQSDLKGVRLETGTSLDQKIQVQDLRTTAENGVTEASLRDGNFVTTVTHGDGTADITMQLSTGGSGGEKAVPVAAGGREASFGAMLSNQLQNNATEFVRTGSIILRDGNVGTINLVLHPESLGNVKISLELNDKAVSAQIQVASEEAFQAFKDSISSLKLAFADSGFDTGSFDLSWAGDGQQQQGRQGQQQQAVAFANTLYGEMLAEDQLDTDVEGEILQKMYSDSSQVAVNIMA